MDRGPVEIDQHGIRPPAAFAVADERVGEAVVVRLEGELDLAASAALAAHVDAAAGHPVVIDLERVTFADSSAVRALVRAQVDIEARGDRLALAAIPTVVARVLELTGTAGLFASAPTRAAALERLGAG